MLDQFSPGELRQWLKGHDEALAFHWAFYAALLDQRTRIRAEISEAIRDAATGPFDMESWHRVVPYEYSFQPLSAVGSVKTLNGGRFNIGGIYPDKFPEFPALYLAADRETALAEKLGIPRAEAEPVAELEKVLLAPDWREWPALFDVPTTSQIFGQEVRAAGIEGIIYPSTKTDTPCVAIFPDLLGLNSFVELVGPAPPDVDTRLDATTWRRFV